MRDDAAAWYLPEHLTHLYYSPVYVTLTPAQRRVYNRLHACYLCEMCAFLEGELPRYYLQAASAPNIPKHLLSQAQALSDSEKRHASMFRALARRLSPGLYSKDEYILVRLSSLPALMARVLFNLPVLRPMLLWIALIQEERGVYYGEEILRQADHLDPTMVEVQRKHLADEEDHLGFGEALLPLYWNGCRPWVRRLNARLFRFVLREYLGAPKRAGVRLIHLWVKECPDLETRKAELVEAMRALDRDRAFHNGLYSRKIVPKTFELFDRYSEFGDLGKTVWGYSREVNG